MKYVLRRLHTNKETFKEQGCWLFCCAGAAPHSPHWTQALYVAEGDLELLVLCFHLPSAGDTGMGHPVQFV